MKLRSCASLFAVSVVVSLTQAVGCGSPSEDPNPAAAGPLLVAPEAGKGFQIGTAPFDVPAGAEVQNCFFYEVPSDTDVFVDRITLAQEPGSHHFNVFRVNTIVNLSGKAGDVVKDGECWKAPNWKDWPIVINSQQSNPGHNVNDWQLPEGVAHKLKAHELLMVQSHYVNASTQVTPGVGHALVNFYTVDAAKVTAELGTVFATNQNIKVCPGEQDKQYEATCKFAKAPVTIVAANGHFHSRGTNFTIGAWDSVADVRGANFYDSKSWNDPPFVTNVSVPVVAQGGIKWTCEYSAPASSCGDPANSCCYTFGGKVESQEHCNAFVYYYPKQDNINCF